MYGWISYYRRSGRVWSCILPNSVVDASTINAFKAQLDKFWMHQAVKYEFTADLTGTGNRSEEVPKWECLYILVRYTDVDLSGVNIYVCNLWLSWVNVAI